MIVFNKNYFFIFLIILTICYYINIQTIEYYDYSTYNINLNNVQKITREISIIRPVNSINLQFVKQNVINYIQQIPGFIVEEQKFQQNINNIIYDFSNIIAYNQNSINDNHKSEIILSAHIDGLNFMEGAIDSATSIALIIEIVKQIINIDLTYPIRIIFFDGEEAIDGKWSQNNTLIGSTYYVNNMLKRNSQVFILDLIGGDIIDNKIYCFTSNKNSFIINHKLSQINKLLYPNTNDQIFIDPNIQQSSKKILDDHIPFSNANIPFIHLIPSIFPKQHHTIDDNYSNINWNYINIFGNILLNYFLM